MIKKGRFLFGILIGMMIAVILNPILSETYLTQKYEKHFQEKMKMFFPTQENELSLRVKYCKRYLAYGDLIIGKEQHFFILDPHDTAPIKIFTD